MSFLRMTNGEMKKSGIPIIIDWQVKNVRKTQMIAEEDQTIQEGGSLVRRVPIRRESRRYHQQTRRRIRR